MPDPIPPDKLSAYLATLFRFDAEGRVITLRIGHQSTETLALFTTLRCDCAAFVTAFNPRGTAQPLDDNLAANRRLLAKLEPLAKRVFSGAGHDPEGHWDPEISYMAFGVDRDRAIALGAEFGQDAVVWVGSDGVPALLITR